jgi:hypothetical protein
MDMHRELQQAMWEVIAEMERTLLRNDTDLAQRLERIAWRLVGALGDKDLSCVSDSEGQLQGQATLL